MVVLVFVVLVFVGATGSGRGWRSGGLGNTRWTVPVVSMSFAERSSGCSDGASDQSVRRSRSDCAGGISGSWAITMPVMLVLVYFIVLAIQKYTIPMIAMRLAANRFDRRGRQGGALGGCGLNIAQSEQCKCSDLHRE